MSQDVFSGWCYFLVANLLALAYQQWLDEHIMEDIRHSFLSSPLSLQKGLLGSFQPELHSWRKSNWMCPVSETPWHLTGMENAFLSKPVNSTSPPLWDHSTQPSVSHPIFIKRLLWGAHAVNLPLGGTCTKGPLILSFQKELYQPTFCLLFLLFFSPGNPLKQKG